MVWLRRLRLLLLSGWYLAALVAGGLVVARELSWPPGFWSTPPQWVIVVFVVTAAATAALPLRGAFSERRLTEKRAKQLLTNYERLMFIDFVEKRSSLALVLAVHVWRIRRRARTALPPWEEYMERV